MKNLLILLSITIFLISCNTRRDYLYLEQPKFYKFKVTYINSDIDTIDISAKGRNFFTLEESDLKRRPYSFAIISGVRYFNVLSIDTINKNNKYKPTIKL